MSQLLVSVISKTWLSNINFVWYTVEYLTIKTILKLLVFLLQIATDDLRISIICKYFWIRSCWRKNFKPNYENSDQLILIYLPISIKWIICFTMFFTTRDNNFVQLSTNKIFFLCGMLCKYFHKLRNVTIKFDLKK